MSKYNYTDDMEEISGFGGGYEEACRRMVVAGLEWLDENPNADPKFSQFKNIYGVTTDENEDMKEMQQAMLSAENDCSGAMMQATTNHVLFINKNGWDKYVEEMTKEEAV